MIESGIGRTEESSRGDRHRRDDGRGAATEGTPPVGTDGTVESVVRWASYSILLNVALAGLHGLVAATSGSLAVTAELIHNLVDLVAAAIVLVGIKLAMRKDRAFPYGLYKVENLVGAGLAGMIFFSAYEVAQTVLVGSASPPHVDAWMLVSLVATAVIPVVFSHFELRAALAANSPALMADAREYRVHVYTTGLAFAALLSAWFDLPLDRIAALIIVVAVAKTGWELLTDALRVLLDASLDPKSLGEIRQVIAGDPAIAEVNWITGRNAGRFRFVEVGVGLRLTDLAKAEAAVQRIESRVRSAVPHVERVLLHMEPRTSPRQLYAVPLADLSGTISEHFGEAPYFGFVTVDRVSGAIEEQHVQANPHRRDEKAKGIRVAEWLAARKVDKVLLPKSLEGKGPAYVFRDAGIDVERTSKPTLADHFSPGSH